MNRVVILGIACFLPCLLVAKDFWVNREYGEWSRKDVVKMLTSSPWASSQIVRLRDASLILGPSPTQSASACAKCPEDAATLPEGLFDPQLIAQSEPVARPLKFFVRFRTAAPVRMALARLAVLNGKMTLDKAAEYLSRTEFPGQVVVVGEAETQEGANLLSPGRIRIPFRKMPFFFCSGAKAG